VEGLRLRATLFSSSVYPGRAPQGHVLLTCFIGGAWNSVPARQPPERLQATILRELRPLLAITGEPTFLKHISLPHSLPQYNVGYSRVLDCIERMEARFPGFFLAGNYRQGVSLRGALLSGYETAGRLLATLEPELAL
jgi:oxygen-dependent protoporphyrinogen oxidase